ncbi:hypothetical protein [Kordiimonas aestuarii]|uniref:hypothetical protein n=1 Tax=Kordiimonas aestuarii TaxID=1005925 RepID=UPI0021CECABB|nr:hypothetical protein [Kordiimonas aestuarii]
MGVFGMITSVVLIVMIAVVTMVSISAKSKTGRTREQDKARDKRIAALEERVRVLEKLATDRSARLKEEIDAL